MVEVKLEIALGVAGVVEEWLLAEEQSQWMLLEDKPSGRVWIAGYFAGRAEADDALPALVAALDPEWVAAPADVRDMPDEDWVDSYKAHFRPCAFGRLHWVPVWEREVYRYPEDHTVLWLDPGMAFGTGNHETTRLCCERLVTWVEAWLREGRAPGAARVIDAGCGSGILALSAARLSMGHVAGFDNDPEAIRVSTENAALNELTGTVDFFEGDLVSGLADREADLVMANIQADVLMRFCHELTQAVSPGGELVLSGILASENAHVQAAFAAVVPGWARESRVLGEWSDVRLRRPPGPDTLGATGS